MYKFDPLVPEKYDLSPMETLAYQCCIVYLTLAYKIFPNYRHAKFPSTGDVRKSALFKHCYKMCKNLEGKIKKEFYPYFIKAQMDIFKTIFKTTGVCPIITPSIISGSKSFKRWLVWKNKYDAIKVIKSENTTVNAERQLLINEFAKTKLFMQSENEIFDNFESFLKNKEKVIKFVILKKLSPYYVAISPWVKKLPCEISEEIYQITNSETIQEIINQEDRNIHQFYFANEY